MARVVDTAVAGGTAQPVDHVLRRFERSQVLMELQEDLLRHFLSQGAVVQEMVRDAEYHPLVFANDLRKGRWFHHSQDIYEGGVKANALSRKAMSGDSVRSITC